MIVLWECNNYDCSYKYKGEFMGKTHLPDTDCPECGYHDSMIETGKDYDPTAERGTN